MSLESFRDGISLRLEGLLEQLAEMSKNNRITPTLVDQEGRIIPGVGVETVGARQVEINAYRHAYETTVKIVDQEFRKIVAPGSVQPEDDRPDQPFDPDARIY